MNQDASNISHRPVIGIIPAGGFAKRISPLPCSKELYPIGFRNAEECQGVRPKVVCQYLIERMARAGVTTAYMILREGKWDIPAFFGDGAMVNMNLAYLVTCHTEGPAYTVNQAYPFVKDSLVVFGFPDILFEPENGFEQVREHQAKTDADIVLGLFRVDRSRSDDRVICDQEGRVTCLIPGPTTEDLEFTWNIAIWKPTFTEFLRRHLLESTADSKAHAQPPRCEVTMGIVLKAAFEHGLRIDSVRFQNDWYLDIGTPGNLVKAVRQFSS